MAIWNGYLTFGTPCTINFDHVTLTVTFGLQVENFNSAHNFLTIRHRVFIFGICVTYNKTFLMVPSILITWPWPWPLTYIWKTLTLHIIVLPLDIGLSYLAYVFLMTRPFWWYHKFWSHDIDNDLHLKKTLTLHITFLP